MFLVTRLIWLPQTIHILFCTCIDTSTRNCSHILRMNVIFYDRNGGSFFTFAALCYYVVLYLQFFQYIYFFLCWYNIRLIFVATLLLFNNLTFVLGMFFFFSMVLELVVLLLLFSTSIFTVACCLFYFIS